MPTHLAHLVTRAAAGVPEHPAIIDVGLGLTTTWGELDAAVTAEAARIRDVGVGPGDRVVVRLSGGLPFCVAVLGALRADAIAVPFGPLAVSRESAIVLADCATRIVIAPADDGPAGTCAAAVGVAVLPPPDPAARADTEDDVRAHCTARPARFKVPAVIEFVERLPCAPTGELARRQLTSPAETP